MARVGIVICNYNKKDMVLQCIQSVLENKYQDFVLFVVDNGSTDGSYEAMEEAYGQIDRVILMRNEENLGGSGGFNVGLRRAYKRDFDYLMCVDNDAFLDENAIFELVDFLDRNSDCGIAASKIYHMENPDLVQNFGQKIDFSYFCTEVEYLNYFEDGSMPDVNFSDAVPACSLMIRMSLVDRIGFLPEDNFLYWDDTEWCYLCRKIGYKIASVGSSKALHSMGAKREDVNTFPTYYAWRNWISFFLRYTKAEKLDDCIDTFLNSVFQVQFEGFYKGEIEKATTVMAAFDDAIHGITGKAGPDRIFDIHENNDKITEIISRYNNTCAENEGYESLASYLDTVRRTCDKNQAYVENEKADSFIIFCESVLHESVLSTACEFVKDGGGDHIYFLDLSHIIVSANEMEELHKRYKQTRDLFFFSEKALFKRLALELRP